MGGSLVSCFSSKILTSLANETMRLLFDDEEVRSSSTSTARIFSFSFEMLVVVGELLDSSSKFVLIALEGFFTSVQSFSRSFCAS